MSLSADFNIQTLLRPVIYPAGRQYKCCQCPSDCCCNLICCSLVPASIYISAEKFFLNCTREYATHLLKTLEDVHALQTIFQVECLGGTEDPTLWFLLLVCIRAVFQGNSLLFLKHVLLSPSSVSCVVSDVWLQCRLLFLCQVRHTYHAHHETSERLTPA